MLLTPVVNLFKQRSATDDHFVMKFNAVEYLGIRQCTSTVKSSSLIA